MNIFKPKFTLKLDKTAFPADEAVCLGSQLIQIIEVLKDALRDHVWYVFDVDAFTNIEPDIFSKKIGDNEKLIELSKNIDQFLSGVFLAIDDSSIQENALSSLKIGTEDQEFREINMGGILLEIRAFDTAYFEIYSEKEEIINKLYEAF